MDKFVQYLFLILFPFYPLWAWLSYSLTKLHINKLVILVLLPITLYYIIVQRLKLPRYLLLFFIFTIYHFILVFINHLVPLDTNWLFYVFSDTNVFACVAFFIIENTEFDEKFIHRLNRCIFVTVIITLIVSIIQIKYPYFF